MPGTGDGLTDRVKYRFQARFAAGLRFFVLPYFCMK